MVRVARIDYHRPFVTVVICGYSFRLRMLNSISEFKPQMPDSKQSLLYFIRVDRDVWRHTGGDGPREVENCEISTASE